MTDVRRLVVFAPNWLGDAVMAVPCVEAIRRQHPSATIAVAARRHLAPLMQMSASVDEVVSLDASTRFGGWLAAWRDSAALRAARFDAAILLPNSFRAAWIAWRAGIPQRWGYAADGRTTLLTRAVPRVRGGHQVEYYQRLLDGLGIATWTGAPTVNLRVPDDAREWAQRTLASSGWTPGARLAGMAPGAAYGTAKQWPPERFARLALDLAADDVRTVLVGSVGDRATCDAIAQAASAASCINLAGATDLRQLAAVMAACNAFVSNDSGAMHLAAAVGTPIVAIFGSTNEKETAPIGRAKMSIVATDAWCRPCMLRECPLDHACMTGIDVARVRDEVVALIGYDPGDAGSGLQAGTK